MTIANIRTHLLSVPFTDPPKTGFLTLEAMDLLVVEIETADGVTGTGHLHPLAGGMRTLDTCIHEMLAPLLIGQSIDDPEALWDLMWRATFIQGRMGITVMAMSAIDIAVWDALGRRKGQPLWQIWGGSGAALPIYGSGCFRGLGHDGMIEKAERYVQAGFSAIKMQIGHVFTADEDHANVRDMRAALGGDVEIMVDANQAFDTELAIAAGRMLDDYAVTWLEEPVMADNIDGYLRIADAIETPVVGGENHFLSYDVARLIEAGTIPILQPDIMRGGYTGLRRLAADAARKDIKIAPHVFPEMSAPLAAALPNASWLEQMGWYDHLWTDPMVIENGMATPPDRPGHGMDFRPEIFRDHPYRA